MSFWRSYTSGVSPTSKSTRQRQRTSYSRYRQPYPWPTSLRRLGSRAPRASKQETGMALLESIERPADLKILSARQLAELASEIRDFLVEKICRTGGHLGP